jgi:hypothetical protein
MRRDATGRYEITSSAGEAVRAFVPAPLPPDPPLELAGPLQALHERALLACGRLDGISSLLPDPELFLYAYVRREALLSSQIEGTQSSLSDLLLFELCQATSAFGNTCGSLNTERIWVWLCTTVRTASVVPTTIRCRPSRSRAWSRMLRNRSAARTRPQAAAPLRNCSSASRSGATSQAGPSMSGRHGSAPRPKAVRFDVRAAGTP